MFPTRAQVTGATYEILKECGSIDLQSLYVRVEREFEMTPEEIAREDSEGNSLIEHEIRWALQTLKHEGKAKRGDATGIWTLVRSGRRPVWESRRSLNPGTRRP